jgi:hypothetical protein
MSNFHLVNQHDYRNSLFSIGKSAISMAIFNSYVSLPTGCFFHHIKSQKSFHWSWNFYIHIHIYNTYIYIQYIMIIITRVIIILITIITILLYNMIIVNHGETPFIIHSPSLIYIYIHRVCIYIQHIKSKKSLHWSWNFYIYCIYIYTIHFYISLYIYIWLVVWNIWHYCPIQLGMSTSQLTDSTGVAPSRRWAIDGSCGSGPVSGGGKNKRGALDGGDMVWYTDSSINGEQ